MANFGRWLKKELREMLPVWAFFFVSFSLLALTVSAVLGEYHVEAYEPFAYFAASLIVAKAVILVDAFLKTTRLRNQPLIYATLFDTGIYSAVALFVRHLEELFKLVMRQHLGLAQADHKIFEAMAEPRYWAMVAWLIALTFTFCTLRELIRCIGSERFMEMFFGKRPSAGRRCPQDIRKVS
jgi:hypothetical protein